MKRYETIFITHPELPEESHSELQGKINSITTAYQGDVLKLDDWGIKKLGYEIRKNTRGHYYLMDYLATPQLVRELERNLRLNDGVLKFLTIKVGDQLPPEAVQALKEKTTQAEKPAPAPAQEPKAEDSGAPLEGEPK